MRLKRFEKEEDEMYHEIPPASNRDSRTFLRGGTRFDMGLNFETYLESLGIFRSFGTM